jgi:hypothetical protein
MIAFNIGVEIGQVAIVAAAFILLFALRKQPWYNRVCLVGGSLVIGVIALYWFVERAFGLA